MPPSRLRAGFHPAVEPPAAFTEPRRAGGEGEKPAVPLQHLRQRFRHGVQPPDPYVEGQSCMYRIRRPLFYLQYHTRGQRIQNNTREMAIFAMRAMSNYHSLINFNQQINIRSQLIND